MENIRALFPLNFSVNKDDQLSATETCDQSESDEMVDYDRQRTMISIFYKAIIYAKNHLTFKNILKPRDDVYICAPGA